MNNLFQSLTQDQKVDFFVRCQDILIKYHRDSSYIIKQNTLSKALDTISNNIEKYQGHYYIDDNTCILWNYIFIANPNNVKQAVVENAYKSPNTNYNGVSIDFFTAKNISNCMEFIKQTYNPQIKYILFIRDGNPKIYLAENIIKGLIS